MTVKEFNRRTTYNGGVDRTLGEWEVLDIHQLPNPVPVNCEVDFYCCNGKNVYLLRLRRCEEEAYTVTYDEKGLGFPPYLIACCYFDCIDNRTIEQALAKFTKLLLDS